ncbi:MAG: hypothetical protein WD314_02960 [Trueperaceae bacterium]
MRQAELAVHSFVIKIWFEELSSPGGAGEWRGHIVHVPDNERFHFLTLDAIRPFIEEFLEAHETTGGS